MMPGTQGDEVELQSVRLASPVTRTLAKDVAYTEEVVVTAKGNVTVAWKGDRTKPAMLTFHDLGLNHVSNFQAFFNYPGMAEMLPYFCVFHINAPGQEEGAEALPEDFAYPTMDEMAEQVNEVINHFAIVRYIGIGVGLGGNVLMRHALLYPERVDCLLLINTQTTAAGWIEWGYQKRNVNHMRQHGVTQAVLDYLMWHHFGDYAEERAHDLVHMYKNYFNNDIQPANFEVFSKTTNSVLLSKQIVSGKDSANLLEPFQFSSTTTEFLEINSLNNLSLELQGRYHILELVMEKGASSHQIILKSLLSPEQIIVQGLYASCGVKIHTKTFITLWKLCDLGIPTHAILSLLQDTAKYSSKK